MNYSGRIHRFVTCFGERPSGIAFLKPQWTFHTVSSCLYDSCDQGTLKYHLSNHQKRDEGNLIPCENKKRDKKVISKSGTRGKGEELKGRRLSLSPFSYKIARCNKSYSPGLNETTGNVGRFL